MGKPKQITRKVLVAAAKKQLLQNGQGKITLKNVAETAGVTQGVVYYHFKTKDQLLVSLLQDFIEGIQKKNSENESMSNKNQDKLQQFIKEEAYKAQVGSEQYQMLFELVPLALHQREMKGIMAKSIIQRIGAMSELVDGDPLRGRMLTAILDGLALQTLFDPAFNEKEAYDIVRKWFVEKMVE